MTNITLFLLFAKFGALCFGGGYMIIPLLYHAFVEVNPVFTLEAFGNLLSLSQITPGAVSINSATYIGFVENGISGAVFATIGLVTPTFILATIAIYTLKKWEKTNFIQGFLKGARLVALAMILCAIFIFMGMSVFTAPIPFEQIVNLTAGQAVVIPENFGLSPQALLICILSMFCLYYNKISVTYMLVLSGIVGIGLHMATAAFSPDIVKNGNVTNNETKNTQLLHTVSHIDDAPFDCDDCVNGECGAWTNACICWRDQLNWSGKNCDEPAQSFCKTNTDCPASTYCNIDKNAKPCEADTQNGACFMTVSYAPLTVQGRQFIISRALMNHFSAVNFCMSLGQNWYLASRGDLQCNDMGIGCVNTDYVAAFQSKMGIRGFLWLDDGAQNCQAFYIDVNDGAIYNTRMNAVNTAQALCTRIVQATD